MSTSTDNPNQSGVGGRKLMCAGLVLWAAMVGCMGEMRHIHWVLLTSIWGLCSGVRTMPDPALQPVIFYTWGAFAGAVLVCSAGVAFIKNKRNAALMFLVLLFVSTITAMYRWHRAQA
jgi:hypothetical protein